MSRGSIYEKNNFYLWKSKQTAEIYFKPYFEGVPLVELGSYFTWLNLFAPRFPWDPFWGCGGCLKFRGRSRSLIGFSFTNKNVQKWSKWTRPIKKNLKWVGVAFMKKIFFICEKVNKQLKYTLNPLLKAFEVLNAFKRGFKVNFSCLFTFLKWGKLKHIKIGYILFYYSPTLIIVVPFCGFIFFCIASSSAAVCKEIPKNQK